MKYYKYISNGTSNEWLVEVSEYGWRDIAVRAVARGEGWVKATTYNSVYTHHNTCLVEHVYEYTKWKREEVDDDFVFLALL